MTTIKLNIGSGDIKLPGYKNIDGKFGDDITKLKYEDNSVDEIYASHVLEYFDQFECVDVLREWFRVLKKGGIIRIAVPNFEIISKIYIYNSKIHIMDIIGPLYGRMEINGKIIYHKQVFDYTTLKNLLYRTGFKRINNYDCESIKPFSKVDDQSHAYIPHMDKKNGVLISLNVEATK